MCAKPFNVRSFISDNYFIEKKFKKNYNKRNYKTGTGKLLAKQPSKKNIKKGTKMITTKNISKDEVESYYSKDDYYFKDSGEGWDIYGDNNIVETVKDLTSFDQRKVFDFYTNKRKLKGTDLQFAPPKSVSLMFAYGKVKQQKKALEIHKNAVRKCMKYVEENLFFVQKKEHGIKQKIRAKGMLAIGFDHSLNRNLDSQLHTHMLIANSGYIDDSGQSYCTDFRDLYNAKHQLDRIYKAYMRAELEQNGIKTRYDEIADFELADISRDQIELESSRKMEVDQNLKDIGLKRETASALQKQIAALKNRRSKENVTDEEIKQLRINQAKLLNINIKQHDNVIQKGEVKTSKLIIEGYNQYISREAITTRKKAMDEILKHAEQQKSIDETAPIITQEDIEKHLPSIMKNEKMMRLPGQKKGRGDIAEKLISEKLLVADTENQQYLYQGKEIFRDIKTDHIEREIDAVAREIFDFKFEGEQKAAAIGVLKSKDFITAIQGDPGTGKTTLLQAVAKVQGENNIIALSKAGVAAKKLGEEIKAEGRTIDKFVRDFEKRERLFSKGSLNRKDQASLAATNYIASIQGTPDKPSLFIIDEASMAGEMDMNKLCKIADTTNSKIVLIGDMFQLPGVAAGETFKKFQESGNMQTFHLKEIRRQRSELERKAVEAITLENDAKKSVEILQQNPDIIKEVGKASDRFRKIKNDYIANVKAGKLTPLLITGTNKDKDVLNQKIREDLKKIGKLEVSGETHSTFNGQNKKMDLEICQGERIVFLLNDNDKQVTAGQKILNGDQAIVNSIKDGQIKGLLVDEEGRATRKEVEFSANDYNKFDHAYALSTYKAQGQSVERNVQYHAPSNSPVLSKNEFLVGISRNKGNVNVYTDSAQKMTGKASKWINKNDALKSYEHGLGLVDDHFGKIKTAVSAAEEKIKRDAEILQRRQSLVNKYSVFSSAPRKEQRAINKDFNASREFFFKDIASVKTLLPGVKKTQAEESLAAKLNGWTDKKKLTDDKFKTDKSRHREPNYYKELNRNDNILCDELLKLKGNYEAEKLSSFEYERLNSDLAKIENSAVFENQHEKVLQVEEHDSFVERDNFEELSREPVQQPEEKEEDKDKGLEL